MLIFYNVLSHRAQSASKMKLTFENVMLHTIQRKERMTCENFESSVCLHTADA